MTEYLETPYLYLGLLVLSAAYPIAQSFEWRLQYYKQWKPLAVGILVMMMVFIPWDIWFTLEGVWWFREDYITGWSLFHLPLEEWLFFIIVPFACIFIYEVLKYYLPKHLPPLISKVLLTLMFITVASLLAWYPDGLYTRVTFIIALIILGINIINPPKWTGLFLETYAISWLPFLLINGALTGAFTDAPVVNYNPEEITGIRIFTIPLEDSIYNFIMLYLVVVVYEYVQRKKQGDHPI